LYDIKDAEMDKIFNFIRKILFTISITAIGLMMLIIFMQVITRYIFGFTFSWSEELSRFLFVWVVFIGSALIMGDKGHMAVSFLSEKLKGTVAGRILFVIIKLFALYFIFLMITQGFKMSVTMMFHLSPALGIPMGFIYTIIPVSGLLMLLYVIKDIIIEFSKKKPSTKVEESPMEKEIETEEKM
jgi:TRAP-type C4-dicarboxylate transport system permease small subunit